MKTTVVLILLVFTIVLSKEITSEKSLLCQPCKMVANLVKEELKKPNEELLKTLVSGCNKLGGELSSKCKMTVVLFGNDLLKFLREEFTQTPQTVCSKISLCPSQFKQDGALCAPCQLGVQYIKDYLEKPDDELIKILAEFCGNLPEDFIAPCKAMVAIMGKQLIEFVRANVNDTPRKICANFGLCSQAPIQLKQDGPVCAPCQLAVEFIKDYMDKPDNELIKILAEYCENLPDNFVGPCKAMVAIMGKQLIEFVRSNIKESPRKICSQFGLCSPPTAQEVKDTILCAPCQFAVQTIKDYANKPEDEIVKILYDLCIKLPDQAQQYCKAGVVWAGPWAVAYVKQHLNEPSRTICARFGICKA